jgi:hypothetical protein
MRNALVQGTLTRAGIAEGECIGISGWRPEVIRQNSKGDSVRIGAGSMRLFPVMGSAYIRAHKMTNNKSKGCLLLVDKEMIACSSIEKISISQTECCSIVDWVHADTPEIAQIADSTGLPFDRSIDLETRLQQQAHEAAAAHFHGSEIWLQNTLRYNHCE